MRREWAVVCDAPDYAALLTAWELPGQSSVPRQATGSSSRSGASSPQPFGAPPGPAPRWPSSSATPRLARCSTSWLYELAEDPPPPSVDALRATSLLNRVVAYVDRMR